MKKVMSLVKRNVLIFTRDKGAVFFSILSMLIVLGLMILFLGNMNSENIVEVLEQAGNARDAAKDRENADYLIQMWTLAGILVTNTVTVAMTVMGNMVKDEVQNRLASFFIAPVKRVEIGLGYVISAWVIGTSMCLITLAAAQGYLAATGQDVLTCSACFKLFGMIALNAFVYAAIAYLIALFIHSESAWSGLLTVIGTLVGFIGAIYLPMAMLPEKVADVLKYLPVLHGAAMMRGVCTEDAIQTTFAGLSEEFVTGFRESMGITVVMNEKAVSLGAQVAYLLILGAAAVVTAALISRKKRMHDR